MRILTSIFIFLFSMTTFAETLPGTERFIFELPKSAGTIEKMQIDLGRLKERWYVNVKSQYRNGTSGLGKIACTKVNAVEFKCRRMDRGGGFELRTSPVPSISLVYFTTDEEGSEVKNFLRAPGSENLIFEGKKTRYF